MGLYLEIQAYSQPYWEGLSSYVSLIDQLFSLVSKYQEAENAAPLPNFKKSKEKFSPQI